jgi:hypothetical protein
VSFRLPTRCRYDFPPLGGYGANVGSCFATFRETPDRQLSCGGEKELQATIKRSSMCREMCRYVVTARPSELISETSPISEISCFPPLVLPPSLGQSRSQQSLSVQDSARGTLQEHG